MTDTATQSSTSPTPTRIPSDTRTSTTTSRDVVRRFVDEVVNQGRYAIIPDLVHPDYRHHGPDGAEAVGHRGAGDVVRAFREGFSDLHAEVTVQAAHGDLVALTMTARGTHDGQLVGIAPTGRTVELPIALVSRIEDGRIIEEWESYDTAALMHQLGVDA